MKSDLYLYYIMLGCIEKANGSLYAVSERKISRNTVEML